MTTPRRPGIAPELSLIDVNIVAGWLALFVAPGDVAELRALHVVRQGRRATEAGYFDGAHLHQMAEAALKLTPLAVGVYLTLNPLVPDILARCANRVQVAGTGDSASDAHVLRRRWLYIDVDAKRITGISATDVEKAQAVQVAQAIRRHLDVAGWPVPIVADSGNGMHLFYRVDLPADDGGLVKRCLDALGERFDSATATVDRTVHNASRIARLPGTLARKGDHTPERPHRRGGILEAPADLRPVPTALLEALARIAPAPSPTRPTHNGRSTHGHRLDVPRWLAARGVGFTQRPSLDAKGRTVFVLDTCPFNPDHRSPDAAVMQGVDGALAFHCFHASCAGRGWQDAKDAIGPPDPDDWDPPLTNRNRVRRTVPEPHGPGAGSETRGHSSDPAGGYNIILQHFRGYYEPTFRRADKIYSGAFGREVSRSEACSAPPIELVEKLAAASDAPRISDGTVVNRSKLPTQFFKTWAGSAWLDMLRSLPEEEGAEEIALPAREQFALYVAEALLAPVSIRYRPKNGDEWEVQRRPVHSWCRIFAKAEKWGDLRELMVWAKWDDRRNLCIAMRVELFGQLRLSHFAGVGPKKFARLAEMYGVGTGGKAAGTRAVILDPQFLAEHLPCNSGIADSVADRPSVHAHATDAELSSTDTVDHDTTTA